MLRNAAEGLTATLLDSFKRLPVSTLMGKLAGTRISLANGERLWALVGNLDARDDESNEYFVTLSIERSGGWFQLARYHDAGYDENGPEALARFLGLTVDDVFPISYDVREYVKGNPPLPAGIVLKEPRVRLTSSQLIAMALR
jgi:hypothetical protein